MQTTVAEPIENFIRPIPVVTTPLRLVPAVGGNRSRQTLHEHGEHRPTDDVLIVNLGVSLATRVDRLGQPRPTGRKRVRPVQGIFQERITASFNVVMNLPPSDRGLKWAGSSDAIRQ